MSFLTNIFESKLKKNLEQFAEIVGGDFIKGGFWDEYKVTVPYRNTVFILDTVKKLRGKRMVRYYRIQCPFVSINYFKFRISSENTFTHAAKVFGMNDILINDRRFDDEFYLESNNKEIFLHFINSDSIREKYWELLKKKDYHFSFEVRRNKTSIFKQNTKNTFSIFTESVYSMGGYHQEYIDEWTFYFETFKLTLDRLIEIGEAEDESPDIQ